MKERTVEYIRVFATKDLEAVAAFFADDMRFWDPGLGSVVGAAAVRDAYAQIFASTGDIRCEVVQVIGEGDWTALEFRLQLGEDHLVGTDWIRWTPEGRIAELRAYVNPAKP